MGGNDLVHCVGPARMTLSHGDTRGSQPTDPPTGDRAQSEVIGVTLLTGVVVIVALLVGGVIVAQTTADDSGPTVDLLADATGTDAVLTHNGGDSVPVTELRVVLEQDDSTTAFTPTAADVTGPDARLDPSERIQRPHGFAAGDLEVLVVHEPSSTVLLDDRVTIPS